MKSKQKETLKPEAVSPPQEQVLGIGLVVHYVEPDGTDKGIHRPAIVGPNYEGNELGLIVLHPQRIYFVYLKMNGKELTPHDENEKQIKTWHYPELR